MKIMSNVLNVVDSFKNTRWWIVLHSPKRLTSRVDELEMPTDFQSTLKDQPHLAELLKHYGSTSILLKQHIRSVMLV